MASVLSPPSEPANQIRKRKRVSLFGIEPYGEMSHNASKRAFAMKSKRKNNKQHGSHQRRKEERYWIEDCADSYKKRDVVDLTVWVSRVELTDDHLADKMQAIAPTNTKEDTEPSERGKTQSQMLEEDGVVEQPKKEEEAKADTKSPTKKPEVNEKPFVYIQRCPSAKGPATQYYQKEKIKLLPDGDCGDGIVNPHPKSQVADKYWAQRKRLFFQFDQGIQLDCEGWFSVTPEAIANHIAERMAVASVATSDGDRKLIVLDACAGVGGNSIAFARRPEVALVVCVDTDDARLRLAANNCRVYGIPNDKVIFVHADVCEVLTSYKNGRRIADATSVSDDSVGRTEKEYAYGGLELLPDTLDAIFLSPPWGGSDYEQIGRRHYELSHITLGDSIDGEELLRLAGMAVPKDHMNVAYFLPRNTNGVRFSHSALKAGFGGCLELEQNLLSGKLKTITAYLDVKNKRTE
jgi:trimethylguanosine synthase